MDITFVDPEKQRKWTYDHVLNITVHSNRIKVTGLDDITDKPYVIMEKLSDFEYIELRKGVDDV